MISAESHIVRLQNVSRQFGTQEVLCDLTITVQRGQTLALIGESGCGKSVTMKIMMQLLRPTTGSVSWFGQDIARMRPKQQRIIRLKFGYLFQGSALFDSLNVYENVAFGLRGNGAYSESEIRDTVLERLSEVGLSSEAATKRPAELSGGMQKRVGLARALTLSPEVMYYDEPTTGLDPVTSRRIDDLIDLVKHSRNVSSVVVTHDMQTVQRVADRVIMLSSCCQLHPGESQVLFEGSVTELFEAADPRVADFVRGKSGDDRVGAVQTTTREPADRRAA